jgi:hypothetical protein
MIQNWKNAVDAKYCAAVVAGSEMLTRLNSITFSLSFYTSFSRPDSPNSSTTPKLTEENLNI